MRSDRTGATYRDDTRPGPHLGDDQLIETYVLAGEHHHLSVCRECQARYEELVRALQCVREDADREADAAFSAERLRDQRERIMRKIERHDHPGEVVAFPNRTVGHPAMQHVFAPARRWVAVAAAAGLAAGMFLGFAVDRRMQVTPVARIAPPPAAATIAAWQATDDRDTDFLVEVEDALMGSRAVELRAIDTMTTPVEIREASYPR